MSEMDDPRPQSDGSFDPTRRLCPDGACVGIMGADGVCSACGRTEAQATAGEELDSPADAAPLDAEGRPAAFDSARRLCDDGSCVGVIGDDGACHVCGRRASASP